jgi:probable rRNA maturation factor
VKPASSSARSFSLKFTVQFATDGYAAHRVVLSRPTLKRWLKAALFTDATLTLRFVDREEGQRLNAQYRGKNQATNILTFVYTEPDEPIVSDLVLCCPTIEEEAHTQKITLAAHYAHLIIHGALHAQGYRHDFDAEAGVMEALEVKLLNLLGFDNPY